MARPTYDQLVDILADKDRQIAESNARVSALEQENRELLARIQKLEQLLEKVARGNKRQAARSLGWSINTLRDRLKRYDI